MIWYTQPTIVSVLHLCYIYTMYMYHTTPIIMLILHVLAGADKRVLVWDIGKAHKLCELKGHSDTVYQLMFSRDGTILASGTYIVHNVY